MTEETQVAEPVVAEPVVAEPVVGAGVEETDVATRCGLLLAVILAGTDRSELRLLCAGALDAFEILNEPHADV